jgi:hypothetical protein
LTLTASVSTSGHPVSPGLIRFCKAEATHCEDLNILGQAQLTASGSASFNLILPIGAHRIRAEFRGTKSNAASSSSNETLNVNGKYPTATVFVGLDQTVDTYALTAAVTTFGQTALGGMIAFKDNTNHQLPVVTSPVGSPTMIFKSLPTSAGESSLSSGPVADFNRDGKLDQLTYEGSTSSWVVLFGNGDGTFVTGPSTSTSLSYSPGAVVIGDFNNDDIPDLAFAQDTAVVIRLGNGDGRFSAAASVPVGQHPDYISVGDFDGDGNADLIASSVLGTAIWLGNGAGGFSSFPSSMFPRAMSAIQVADFNGDGLADFEYIDQPSSTISSTAAMVYLATPDGPFVSTTTPITCDAPCATTVTADFNGDGKPDFAVSELDRIASSYSEVILALGNGDGTFDRQTGVLSYPVAADAVGDFNGDGKADIFLAPQGTRNPNSYVAILFGSGDGTFTQSKELSLGFQRGVIGDFNGDWLSDINGNPTAVSLTEWQYTASASGVTLTGPPGFHSVFANFEGDSMHAASVSRAFELQGPKAATVVTLSASPTPIVPGQPARLVATVTPSTVGNVRATGKITFANGVNVLGHVWISEGRAVFNTSTLSIGKNISLVAYYSGDSVFNLSVSVPVHLTTLGRLRPVSTIQFSVSPSPQVPQGTVVTLSAKVLDAGKPLPNGLVVFYGATAAHPGHTILGQVQLNSSGVATMKFRPPLGSLGFQAVYQGTNTHEGCGSDWQSLTVTGKLHTSTTISADPPNYSATVTAYGPLAASGDASFIDATDSNSIFATAPLKLTNTDQSVARPILLGKDAGMYYPLDVADFNGDGILDMVAIGPTSPLSILFGSPDGSFAPQSTGVPYTGGPDAIADFNGDGIPDLAWGQRGQPSSVAISLGSGDGTFSMESTYSVGPNSPTTLVAGDFNGDGTPDLMTASEYQGDDGAATGWILLGDGKGGFRTAPSVALGARQLGGPAIVADFNGDGFADVATTVYDGFRFIMNILLSKGDGTFLTSTLPTCATPAPELVAADFNNDGTQDILVSGCSTNLQMLLGNGDGTFVSWSLPGPLYGEQGEPAPATTGDFNGDGVPDVILANSMSGKFGILLGKGDGVFAAGPLVSVPGLPYLQFLVVGDFSGDGIPDFALAGYPNIFTGEMGVPAVYEWLSYVQQTSQAKATNVTLPGSGTQEVFALYPGDATHIGSYSPTVLAAKPSLTH